VDKYTSDVTTVTDQRNVARFNITSYYTRLFITRFRLRRVESTFWSFNDKISMSNLANGTPTEIGELIGVLWFLLLGVTGAHINGLDWSKLPVDPLGLWLAGMKVFVSADTFQWPFFWFSIFFLTGRSFRLYFRWFSSSGLQNESSSGCLMPEIGQGFLHVNLTRNSEFRLRCYQVCL